MISYLSFYLLQASDGKFNSQCLVHITVLDVNNNHPEFEQETYVASLPEDIPVGEFRDQYLMCFCISFFLCIRKNAFDTNLWCYKFLLYGYRYKS